MNIPVMKTSAVAQKSSSASLDMALKKDTHTIIPDRDVNFGVL